MRSVRVATISYDHSCQHENDPNNNTVRYISLLRPYVAAYDTPGVSTTWSGVPQSESNVSAIMSLAVRVRTGCFYAA